MRLTPSLLVSSGIILMCLGTLLGILKNRMWDRLLPMGIAALILIPSMVLIGLHYQNLGSGFIRPLLWGVGIFALALGIYQTVWTWNFKPDSPALTDVDDPK